MNRTRLLVGTLLIVLGVLFAVDVLGWWETSDIVSRWWPLVLVAVGAVRIIIRPPDYGGGITFMIIGVLLLDATADIWPGNAAELIWPLLLIGVGLALVLRRYAYPGTDDELMHLTAIFSARRAVSSANPFRGASAVALFGGVDLDLRPAVIDAEGAFVDATAMFGGVKLIVPPEWRVVMSGPAIFGGNENKTEQLGPLPPSAPVLTVRAFALFGGVEVQPQPGRPGSAVQVASVAPMSGS